MMQGSIYWTVICHTDGPDAGRWQAIRYHGDNSEIDRGGTFDTEAECRATLPEGAAEGPAAEPETVPAPVAAPEAEAAPEPKHVAKKTGTK